MNLIIKLFLFQLRFLLQCLPNGCPTEIIEHHEQTHLTMMLFASDTLSHEEVHIYVDQQTGALLVLNKDALSIEQKDDFGEQLERILKERIQGRISPNSINANFLDEIRMALIKNRVEKTIQQTGNTTVVVRELEDPKRQIRIP